MDSSWIPTTGEINQLLSSWKTRKVLDVLRKNNDSTTLKSFEAGLNRVLLTACREDDTAVLQKLLPLSLRHYKEINHLYTYKIRTEKKHPELIEGFTPFYPQLTWNRWHSFDFNDSDKNFLPSVELQGALLHIAAEEGNLKALQLLISQGANIDVVNCCGRTPLMVGVHHVDVVKFLIANGSNVNHQDKTGQTVLMLLVWKAKSCKYLLKALLSAGANPKIVDRYNKTMVHYACEFIIDGDALLYAIENDLFADIECKDDGAVHYAGIPLVITHGFKHFQAKKNFPLSFQIYLQFCELLSMRTPEDYTRQFTKFVKFSEAVGYSHTVALPQLIYNQRKEVTSIDKLNQLLSSSTNATGDDDVWFEFKLQKLLISERLLGPNSQEAICLLGDIIKVRQYYKIGDLICYFLEKMVCLLEKCYCYSSIMGYLGYTSRLEHIYSAGIEQIREHFLSIYAKVISLAFSKVDANHVHCYHHAPKYDEAVVLFGTSYMKVIQGEFIGNVTHIITHFISGNRILQLDNNVLRALISSCEIYPYCPAFEKYKTLVQPSTILYAYLSQHCYNSVTDHDIGVCAKICELSTNDLINLPVPDRQTLLHYAVQKNSRELVEFLLKRGAHYDSTNAIGLTPSAVTNVSAMKLILSPSPNKLFCFAARAVANGYIDYHKLDLPEKIVQLITLHDKRRFK